MVEARWLVGMLLIGLLFYSLTPLYLTTAGDVYISQPLTREKLCDFIASLAVDLGDRGKCLVESPLVERDVCYTSSNHLAYYALRYVCGYRELADLVYKFLESYPTDFYDYHQVLVGKPIPQPFTSIEHVVVDVVNNVRIVHVKRTTNEITDYYRYANLIVYKALLHLQQGDRESALRELEKLEELWDGLGFADAYHQETGKYEAYKLALAVYAYRALGLQDNVDKCIVKLLSINPYTTLYADNTGEGDLNLETASITLLALYSTLPNTFTHKPTLALIIIIATTLVATVATLIIAKHLSPRHHSR
jgi:tetratricopeptide (TPR) repeat protein